jgi:hypothetical protein
MRIGRRILRIVRWNFLAQIQSVSEMTREELLISTTAREGRNDLSSSFVAIMKAISILISLLTEYDEYPPFVAPPQITPGQSACAWILHSTHSASVSVPSLRFLQIGKLSRSHNNPIVGVSIRESPQLTRWVCRTGTSVGRNEVLRNDSSPPIPLDPFAHGRGGGSINHVAR